MSGAEIVALSPLAALVLTATGAMLLAPLAPMRTVRGWTALGLVAALALAIAVDGVAPDGITPLLAHDRMASFGSVFAAAGALGALALMRGDGPGREGPALAALVALGGAVLVAARHAAPLFLGLEVMSLALIGLFAFPLTRPALEAAYKYLLLSGLASAVLLFGMALAHAGSGSLVLADWGGPGAGLAAALVLAGIAFKLALAPFHHWAPDVFSGAPPAAALLSGGIVKGCVALALLRLVPAGLPEPVWQGGLMALGVVSILLGNVLALVQDRLMRMLGYSSVAHAGYLAALVAADGGEVPGAVALYVASYAPALFCALAAAASLGPRTTARDLRGLARARPVTGLATVLGLVSLAGLPISGGFVAKIYLLVRLAGEEAWLALVAAVIGSILGILYYMRFLTAALATGQVGAEPAVPLRRTAAEVLAMAAILLLGVAPFLLIDLVA